ncbi:MAG: RagB/SusD family nutrient uptake outer membrane protein [Prolixibacteraceae bacterium]|jgi:hypothetical protein|nr:RagB/SusD family nutrient uptake outer membrane protein [Prolixibacteraceae bacterium]
MKKYYISAVIAVLTFFLTGCESYLDRDITTYLTFDQVTKSYDYTKNRVAAVYGNLPVGFTPIDGAMMASASDEAEHTLETSAIHQFNIGSWNAFSNPDWSWGSCYRGIRKANQFLVSADSVNLDIYKYDPTKEETYKFYKAEIKRWKYEVRFLRAFFHYELMKRYGGIPIQTSAGSIDDDLSATRRNSLAECIKFITDECDTVARVLPEKHLNEDLGRITKGAALALKSRVLLYAASDLYNTPAWAGGYANPELISLTGDRQARWKAAADAAKEVIDLAGAGYALSPDYPGLFGPSGFLDPEVIFCVRGFASNYFELANVSVGFNNGQSGTTPSQNLVDAYEMNNGKAITDPDSGYDPQNPYANRDPRLQMTVVTNNSQFKGRAIQCWRGGLDGPPIARTSRTGYYLKKYVNENLNLVTGETSVHSWIVFRLAEIYLNYAEALNEYDPGNADIKKYVELVRQRPGVNMPALPDGMNQSQMRERIRNERKVELAFEDHRLWDARRWMQAPAILGAPLRGVKVTKNAIGTFNYQVITVENRAFAPEMYFYPIPQSEIFIAGGLVQNPLWK